MHPCLRFSALRRSVPSVPSPSPRPYLPEEEHGCPLNTDRKMSGRLPRRVKECAVPRGTTAKTPAWSEMSLPSTLCVPSPPST